MGPILTAVTVTAAIAVALAVLLTLAERVFVQSGPVRLSVNDGEPAEVSSGAPLLQVLRGADIFVPSACGGRGTCGTCKVKVTKGGGPLLPTEKILLTPAEMEGSMRLSCQVKVRGDTAVELPASMLEATELTTVVEKLEKLNYDTRRVVLKFQGDVNFEFVAGQYVQLEIPPHDGSAEPVQRAYSIASPPTEGGRIELIIRLVPYGIATTFVHELMLEGDNIAVNGPHGEFQLHDTPAEAVFIAGGSGIAPFEAILADMAVKGSKKKVTLIFGAVSKRDLYDTDKLKAYENEIENYTFVPALAAPRKVDEREGETGLVTDVAKRLLGDMTGMEAYLCGSPGMIDACIKALVDAGIKEEEIYYDKFG